MKIIRIINAILLIFLFTIHISCKKSIIPRKKKVDVDVYITNSVKGTVISDIQVTIYTEKYISTIGGLNDHWSRNGYLAQSITNNSGFCSFKNLKFVLNRDYRQVCVIRRFNGDEMMKILANKDDAYYFDTSW
ncbi:MAG: hypothetical protein AB7O73_00910 [Bacteroidia bacterium]